MTENTMTASAVSVDDPALEALRASLRGQLLRPTDADYDQFRRVWNGMFDRRPALIVRCAGVADVVASVTFAREQGLVIAVKGGGHSVSGLSCCDDGLMLDLSLMKSIRVDPQTRTARAEPGALWGDLDHETQAFGLAVTGGQVSHTGIAGLTLGGGFGYLVRKHGFTVDNLLSVDIVTADGQFRHASAEENEDLFWGVRGGGGNFGVVTSLEYQLHPVGPIVFGGLVAFPIEEARAVLMFYRDFMETAPDELATQFVFLTAPPAPFVPEHLHGQKLAAVVACYSGSLEDGAATLAPLRAFRPPAFDLLGPIPYMILQTLIDASNPHGLQYYTKGQYFAELTDEAIDTISSLAPTAPSPFSIAALFSLGGASSRVAEDATAMGNREATFSFDIISEWMNPADAEENIAWTRRLWDATRRFGTGRTYVNLLSDTGEDTVRSAYNPATYERLVALKNKYDPANLFRLNQNIKPTV